MLLVAVLNHSMQSKVDVSVDQLAYLLVYSTGVADGQRTEILKVSTPLNLGSRRQCFAE